MGYLTCLFFKRSTFPIFATKIINPLFKIFKTYSPYSFLALLGVLFLSKFFWLAYPELGLTQSGEVVWSFLFEWIINFLGHSAFLMTLMAAINVLLQSLYLNKIANDNHLFEKRNYFPALVFVLSSSLVADWNYWSSYSISLWFLLIALDYLLPLGNKTSVRKEVFNVGLCLGLSSLVSVSVLIFLPLIFIGMVLLRPFKISEMMLVLLGLLTPYYFSIGILFLIDRMDLMSQWFLHDLTLVADFSEIPLEHYMVGFLLMSFLAVGILYLNRRSTHALIQIKKRWSLILIGFFLAILPLFFTSFFMAVNAFPLILFFSLVAANIWISNQWLWFGRIMFYIFIVVLIFAQWVPF